MKDGAINYSVTLSRAERAFLEELRRERGQSAIAEVLRTLVRNTRDLYGLPISMGERIRADMARRKLGIVEYIQELLALRYEDLARGDSDSGSNPSQRQAGGR
jgi:hypothetical protein